ncbi:N-acetyltransferase [Paenibacillus xylanexedens]|uniref:GNAT family N-acetyltransferase n=1 Tax=Paenibacillus xylanexedens TaxID=528191 RepID=UPI0011A62F8C|nr:GNAT family N-acetyltransferase [Paenibacillus xylanexedens]
MSIEFDYISEEYTHLINKFDCGNEDVNDFLRDHALELHDCKYCITKLFFKDDSLVGFISTRLGEVSVNRTHIDRLGLIDRVPRTAFYSRSFPIVHIQFLGVDLNYKRLGIARDAISEVQKLAYNIVNDFGCNFVYLESYLTEEAMSLYTSLGFKEIDRDESINTAKMLFSIV